MDAVVTTMRHKGPAAFQPPVKETGPGDFPLGDCPGCFIRDPYVFVYWFVKIPTSFDNIIPYIFT